MDITPWDYSSMESFQGFDHLLGLETALSSGLCDIVEAVQAEEWMSGIDYTSSSTIIDSKYSGGVVSNCIHAEEQHPRRYNASVAMDDQLHQWWKEEEEDTSFDDQASHTPNFMDKIHEDSSCPRIHNSIHHTDQIFNSCKSERSAPHKNSISERSRREKLNQRVYTLRSLVPFVTKMDKASAIKDAITYIEHLQNQMKEIEADIAALQSNENNYCSSSVVSERESSVDMSNTQGEEDRVNAKPAGSCRDGGQTVVQVDACKINERRFRITIFCLKQRCVLAQLPKALESIQLLEVKTSSIISFHGHIVNTVIVETKEMKEMMEAEGLKQVILDAATNYGFLRGS